MVAEEVGGGGLPQLSCTSRFHLDIDDLLVSSLLLSDIIAISMAARLQNRDVLCWRKRQAADYLSSTSLEEMFMACGAFLSPPQSSFTLSH